MKLKTALVSSLLFGGIASAATIVQTESFSFVPAGSQALTFDQFDTSLGTLTGITITTDVVKSGGSLFVDNESLDPASGNITQSVTITLQSTDVSLVDALFQPIGSGVTATSTFFAAVAGDDGDGPSFQNSGPDFAGTNFGVENASDTGEVATIAFGGYQGTGTFVLNTDGVQGFDTAAIGGAAVAIDPATVSGDVTITYTFTPAVVPEPTSTLLGGLAFVLCTLRRRRS